MFRANRTRWWLAGAHCQFPSSIVSFFSVRYFLSVCPQHVVACQILTCATRLGRQSVTKHKRTVRNRAGSGGSPPIFGRRVPVLRTWRSRTHFFILWFCRASQRGSGHAPPSPPFVLAQAILTGCATATNLSPFELWQAPKFRRFLLGLDRIPFPFFSTFPAHLFLHSSVSLLFSPF